MFEELLYHFDLFFLISMFFSFSVFPTFRLFGLFFSCQGAMIIKYRQSACIMVGSSGLEPPTSRLSGVCSNLLSYKPVLNRKSGGGDKRIRTADPLLAKQVLYQLSYTPMF